MTGTRMQLMVLAFCACGVGSAFAGSGDITRRDQNSGSVELSNLADEDAQVVVSAPARPAMEAAIRPTPGTARPAPLPEAVVAERPAAALPPRQRQRDKDEEDVASADQGGDHAGGAGGFGSYNRDAYAAYAGTSGNGGAGSFGSGSGSIGGGTASSGTTAGTSGGNSSGSAGGSGSSATYVDGTSGAGTAPPAGLSPDLLALRVAQYREMMLNEQRGANGLVANPAVQRRYLMMNRALFNGFGY